MASRVSYYATGAAAAAGISGDKEGALCPLNAPLKKDEMVILKPLGTGANRIYLLKREILLL